jgi:hypothetical protein
MEVRLTYQTLKSLILAKGLRWQYASTAFGYDIYAIDGPVVLEAIVYFSGQEPIGFDTTQNATDKTDFETNYMPTANQPVPFSDVVTYTGYQPDPGTAATTTATALQQDAVGRLETHSAVTCDEGSFRDDFTGSALISSGANAWTSTIGTGGSITVASSIATFATGTTTSSSTYAKSAVTDFLPLSLQFYASISQRIANQTLTMGLCDTFPTPNKSCVVQFSGTNNTQATFVAQSSSAGTDTQSVTVTLPNGGNTSTYHVYKIDLSGTLATLSIDGTVVATLSAHLPGPYDMLSTYLAVQNTGAVGSSTSLTIDYLSFFDWDKLQIDTDFSGEPILTHGPTPSGNAKYGNPVQTGGVFNTTQPTVTTGQVVESQSTARGALIVATGVDTFTVNAQGPAASGAAKSGNPVQIGGVFNTTQPTVTTGQVVEAQSTARGALIVATGTDTFVVTGGKTNNSGAPGSNNVGVLPAVCTTAAPSYTTGNIVSLSTDTSGNLRSAVTGTVADASADSGNSVKVGGVARTSNPTAGSSGNRMPLMTDKMGRTVVVSSHVRDLVTTANVSLSTTTETTLMAAAGAGVFLDLVQLVISNGSASAVTVSIRDTTAGSILANIDLSPNNTGGNNVVCLTLSPPWPQTTANTNWTVQLNTAVSTVHVFAQAVKNI